MICDIKKQRSEAQDRTSNQLTLHAGPAPSMAPTAYIPYQDDDVALGNGLNTRLYHQPRDMYGILTADGLVDSILKSALDVHDHLM